MASVLHEENESLKSRLFDLTEKLHATEREVLAAKQKTVVHYAGLI